MKYIFELNNRFGRIALKKNIPFEKLSLSKISSIKPLAIIAHTIKGKGIRKMENNPEWHHKYPNEKEYAEFIRELQ